MESGYKRTNKQPKLPPYDWWHFAIDIHFGNTVHNQKEQGKVPVYATMKGKVSIVSQASGCISITDGSIMTIYAHMREFSVRNNQNVEAGDIVGYIGSKNTGGAHLHYEILIKEENAASWIWGIRGWKQINPLDNIMQVVNPAIALQNYLMRLKNPQSSALLTKQQEAIINNNPLSVTQWYYTFYMHNRNTGLKDE